MGCSPPSSSGKIVGREQTGEAKKGIIVRGDNNESNELGGMSV